MSRKIEVLPYDSRWPELFEAESPKIKAILGDNCLIIHHIGSTSIPGLAAKPIIDMIPVVVDIRAVDPCNPAMEALGYIPRGEGGMPFRRFFQKGEAKLTHHAHVFEVGSPEITRHLLFRDYLRSHPEDRDAYAHLKQKLAREYTYDIEGYISGKHGLIESIIQKSGFNGCRMLQAFRKPEWETYHRIRRQQIFEPIGEVYDLQHPTLNDPHHFHFVFIKNSDMIGALHIELPPGHRGIVRTIAIDRPYQRQGYGMQLLQLAERWIRYQNRSLIQLHARPNTRQFYEKSGYQAMPFEDPDRLQGNNVDMGKLI